MTYDPRTDEQLAHQLQRGEPAALVTLVARHYARLFGYLMRLLDGERATSEDIAQETFLRVLRRIELYDEHRSFVAWLYAIATNLVRDQAARAGTQREVDPLDDDVAGSDFDPLDAQLLAADEAEQVRAALQSLPVHQREVIILTFYDNLSQSAIADILDIPIGTVRSRLSIGIGRLRTWMHKAEQTAERSR